VSTLIVAAIAFIVAVIGSAVAANKTVMKNRTTEWPENEKSETLSSPELHWSIVHIRDDVGSIQNLIVIANGLLAAILAALIFR
jgi:hypothetical protein